MIIEICNSFKKRAFTLIELLTVIAIIGILAAILIPTVGRVRESAKNSTSLSNLRQCAMANQLYADDHKGNTVVGKERSTLTKSGQNEQWQTQLSAYTAKPLAGDWELDPAQRTTVFTEPKWLDDSAYDATQPNQTGYGLNMNPRDPSNSSYTMDMTWNSNVLARIQLAQIQNNSRRAFAAVWKQWNLFPPASITDADLIQASKRYGSGKINTAFFDGHVASLTAADLYKAIVNP